MLFVSGQGSPDEKSEYQGAGFNFFLMLVHVFVVCQWIGETLMKILEYQDAGLFCLFNVGGCVCYLLVDRRDPD